MSIVQVTAAAADVLSSIVPAADARPLMIREETAVAMLLEAARGGDHEAFGSLVALHERVALRTPSAREATQRVPAPASGDPNGRGHSIGVESAAVFVPMIPPLVPPAPLTLDAIQPDPLVIAPIQVKALVTPPLVVKALDETGG